MMIMMYLMKLLKNTLEKIDINRVSTSGYTPASIMIIEILKNIRGRWGEDPKIIFNLLIYFSINMLI